MTSLLPFPAYASSIHHDGSPRYVRAPAGGEPRLGDEVTLRVRAAPDAPIERVLLRTCPDGSAANDAVTSDVDSRAQAGFRVREPGTERNPARN